MRNNPTYDHGERWLIIAYVTFILVLAVWTTFILLMIS